MIQRYKKNHEVFMERMSEKNIENSNQDLPKTMAERAKSPNTPRLRPPIRMDRTENVR